MCIGFEVKDLFIFTFPSGRPLNATRFLWVTPTLSSPPPSPRPSALLTSFLSQGFWGLRYGRPSLAFVLSLSRFFFVTFWVLKHERLPFHYFPLRDAFSLVRFFYSAARTSFLYSSSRFAFPSPEHSIGFCYTNVFPFVLSVALPSSVLGFVLRSPLLVRILLSLSHTPSHIII